MGSFKRIYDDVGACCSSLSPRRQARKANAYSENQSNLRNAGRPRQTKNSFLIVRKTALLNRPDERALIQPERISTEWTNELRRNIRADPTCNLWRALLSLDVYAQTVLYACLIKGWSSSRIAEHLDVSLITIQELLENGREQLKRKLAALSSEVASQ